MALEQAGGADSVWGGGGRLRSTARFSTAMGGKAGVRARVQGGLWIRKMSKLSEFIRRREEGGGGLRSIENV